jgi:hypothetical protein
MVEHQQFFAMACGEAHDVKSRVGQRAIPDHLSSIVFYRPNRSGRIVSIDIAAMNAWQPSSVVNNATR